MNPSLQLFLKANARHLAGMLAASFLVNLFLLALPLFSMLVYDKAMGNEVHDTLWALAIGMGLLLLQEIALRMARVQLVEHAGARWDAHLDARLIRGVLATPLSRALPVADLLTKVRELGATRDVLGAQFLLPVADLPFLLLFAGVVALVAGPLVMIPLAAAGLILAVSTLCQRLGHDRQRTANQAQRAKLTALIDVLAARESLLGQPLAEAAEAHFLSQAQAGARAGARARWWAQTQAQVVPVVMSAASVAMLVAGVYRVEAQAMSVGALISANMIASRMLGMVCGVAPVATRWREFTRALASLGDSVDLKAGPRLGAAFTVDALQAEGLRLDGLGFAYPGQARPVLDGLDLHLRAGELVAVIGASGAGKSTLLRLLAGQVPASQGRLLFGGHRIDDDRTRLWLNRQAVHKTQDPCFLGGRVRDIVSGGDAGASDASVAAALRAAGLGPALDRGDLALNTEVGTNGTGLSGGQRQMLALAAAFHAGRPLLLLDEPTLGLDRAAQESVLRALRPLRAGRCMLVATHASEVIAEADRVIVLERGKVVADAPPQRLMPGLQSLAEREAASAAAAAKAASLLGAAAPTTPAAPAPGLHPGTGPVAGPREALQ